MIANSPNLYNLVQMVRGDPATSFKFTPPSTPGWLVSRHKLAQSLARGLAGRLILLVAPAGYGKTTLLASVASEWGRFSNPDTATHLAWYQLDPSDDDAAVFFERLVQSVRGVAPEFGRLTLGALRGTSDARSRVDGLMAVFLDELREAGEGRIFIAFDGFHHITDQALVGVVEHSLSKPDSPMRLILSTRSDPRFYLSAFRTRDELVELGADDLRLDGDEVRDLIYQHSGQRVSQRVGEEVLKTTGGWPSAANLAAMILAREGGRLPLGGLAPTEHGYRVLVKEVLAGLPPRERELVVKSSLPRELEPTVFGEGMGWDSLPEVLRLVSEVALPVVDWAGPESPTRYEPLFKAALERELGTLLLPQEQRAMRRRLAAYYASRGEWEEAVQGYLHAEAYEEAATLVERAAEEALALGRLDTVLRWIRALSSSAKRAHPRLTVLEARLLLARGQTGEARALVGAARLELEALKDQVGLARRLGALAAVHVLDGRFPLARQAAMDALEGLPKGEQLERAEVCWWLSRAHELMGDLVAAHAASGQGLLAAEQSGQWAPVVRAMLQLGELAYLRGDFSESLAMSGRAVQRSVLLGTEMLSLSLAGGTASAIHRERDFPKEAARVASDALGISLRLYDALGRVRSGLALAAAQDRLGDQGASQEKLEEALALAEKLPARQPERTLALQVAAASLLRRGRRKEALARAKQALQAAMGTSHQVLIDQSRLLLAMGQTASPRTPLDLIRFRRLIDAFQRSDSRHWLSASLRLMAQGYLRPGLGWRAGSNLEKSLALAANEGYVGMPLGLPSQRERLLSLAARKGIALPMAGPLLGVDAEAGQRVLGPLLSAKDLRVKVRAEQAAKGLVAGEGRVPEARLAWPGLEGLETDAAARVSLQSLGGLDARVGDRPAAWPSVDARNLAAYLLVNRGVSLPRDPVLRELWPGVEPWEANVRLQVALYRIREALGPGYQPVDLHLDGRGAYRWAGAGCFVDAELFRERVAEARQLLPAEPPAVLPARVLSLLEGAADLYKGEYLADVAFEWCTSQREELRAQLQWTSRRLIDHYMAQKDWRAAIGYGLQSLRSDPLQEDVIRDVMRCHYRIGDRNGVLQQYREVKMRLAKLRGVWPSDETRQLRIKLMGK